MEPLTLTEYQASAASTAIYPDEYKLTYPLFGLLGEAGEMANKYQKILRDDKGHVTPEKHAALVAELGDVLWYVAAVAEDLGVDLETVARSNLAKLASRKERGVIAGSGDTR